MSVASVPFVVVIPSRRASTRLPDKPLLDLGGRSLVLRVLDVGRASGASRVMVATDDTAIAAAVRADGGEVVLTSPEHPTGTDRLAEVTQTLGLSDETIVVNLQGDEPFVPSDLLGRLAAALDASSSAGIATLATPIRSRDELFEASVVKVVLDASSHALYFSRAPIPFARGDFDADGARKRAMPTSPTYLRHLGLYAYRAGTLATLTRAASSPAEVAESLEQLRALHLGIRIHVSIVDEPPERGIDTPDDYARALARF